VAALGYGKDTFAGNIFGNRQCYGRDRLSLIGPFNPSLFLPFFSSSLCRIMSPQSNPKSLDKIPARSAENPPLSLPPSFIKPRLRRCFSHVFKRRAFLSARRSRRYYPFCRYFHGTLILFFLLEIIPSAHTK